MLKSFITCGTAGEHYYQQQRMQQPMGESDNEVIERAVMNNEYLRMILRDPTLTQKREVNFLKR